MPDYEVQWYDPIDNRWKLAAVFTTKKSAEKYRKEWSDRYKDETRIIDTEFYRR